MPGSPSGQSGSTLGEKGASREKSTLWILTDRETDEVPGTVMLLSPIRNEPLGMDRMERRGNSDSVSILSRRSRSRSRSQSRQRERDQAKRTKDGKIVLNPQPEDSPNDPLNWPAWRRNVALLSIGFYCMLGGGMTTVLAAGFNNVAATYNVSYSRVALTTGLYMMGLGVGSVIFSPTAILFGKRTVYLASAIMFVLSAVWCALSPDYASLAVARVFQGIAVSPVECLPSATIAEIFFLHERAYRVGIYTLLLLGGKNLIPLVSAAIIQSKGWRWVFWIVAVVVGFGGILLFFFNPETFWDRTPRPKKHKIRSESHVSLASRLSRSLHHNVSYRGDRAGPQSPEKATFDAISPSSGDHSAEVSEPQRAVLNSPRPGLLRKPNSPALHSPKHAVHFQNNGTWPDIDTTLARNDVKEQTSTEAGTGGGMDDVPAHDVEKGTSTTSSHERPSINRLNSRASMIHDIIEPQDASMVRYTSGLRNAPAVPYVKTLKPYSGRLSHANWLMVMLRPFILFAYPSVLWSAMLYSLSVGWLIVLSESVSRIYENRATYNFSAIETGLVYISPFVGGVLGTAVAGKVSDIIVRYMARRNGGIYEPEFRLVMAIPIALTTVIGLMGFGWSAQEHDNFMVPTVFFGIISFGCCMGSTTSITFCVDSYRQFAAEALVTLNFSKNILHGLVWSLFFAQWLESDGPKTVFVAIGGIQLACLLLTVPMYIYGKRARMWTVRQKMMERF